MEFLHEIFDGTVQLFHLLVEFYILVEFQPFGGEVLSLVELFCPQLSSFCPVVGISSPTAAVLIELIDPLWWSLSGAAAVAHKHH